MHSTLPGFFMYYHLVQVYCWFGILYLFTYLPPCLPCLLPTFACVLHFWFFPCPSPPGFPYPVSYATIVPLSFCVFLHALHSMPSSARAPPPATFSHRPSSLLCLPLFYIPSPIPVCIFPSSFLFSSLLLSPSALYNSDTFVLSIFYPTVELLLFIQLNDRTGRGRT